MQSYYIINPDILLSRSLSPCNHVNACKTQIAGRFPQIYFDCRLFRQTFSKRIRNRKSVFWQ